jgi:hypothetical protein
MTGKFYDVAVVGASFAGCAPVGGRPDFPGYDYGADSLRSMLPLILELGIATEEEVEIDTMAQRLCADVVASGGVIKPQSL